MKKLIALGLGAVFTLVIFEIVLRLIGFQELYSRDALGPGVKSEMPAVIFVGNSHTMGTGAAPGKSFPDQFREILNVRHGKSPFEIVNLGRGNANSSFVADQMPKFLKTYRPQIVVLMTGETNFWNHLGYSDFVEKTSPGLESIGLKFYNMAYSLRTFRFIQLFSEFVLRPRQDHRFFSDYSEEDRAWIWVASMNNANMFDSSKMTPAEAKDAYETIRSYSDKHGSSLSLLESQIELLPRLWKGRPELEDEWKKQIREYAATFGEKGYSYYLDRLTNTYLRESTDRTIREVAASMLARRPKDFPDLREVVEYHQEAQSYRSRSLDEQIGFYTAVSLAYPTHATARIFLCSKLRQAKRLREAFEVAKAGMELNPLANQSNWMSEILVTEEEARKDTSPEMASLIEDIDKYRKEFVQRFPRHRGRVAKISDEEILNWIEFDLERIRKLVEESGAKLMLQTYPPERWGSEKLVDALLRRFAAKYQLPLSDTSRELIQLEPDPKKRDRFFTKMYGDYDAHLGEEGYAVVARLLERDFVAQGWLTDAQGVRESK